VRWGHSLTSDVKNGNLVLFGGYGNVGIFSDTWIYDGVAWAEVKGGVKPPPRANGHALTWDGTRGEMVLFGGFDENANLANDTWAFDGAQKIWKSLLPGPSARSRYSLRWDPARGNLMLFGGERNESTVLADTWTLDVGGWKSVTGEAPPGRSLYMTSWNSHREKTVLFGGYGNAGYLSDTWLFDGKRWAAAADRGAQQPPARYAGVLWYDDARKRHVLFGGQGATGALNDTWFLYLRGGGCISGTECGSGFCTDGVCCEAAACGKCETCAGTSSGKCTPVTNVEDPDTCATKDKLGCDARGVCVPGIGVLCTKNAECASGFCADGVCCDSACDRACEACSAKAKQGGRDEGKCGIALLGSNPGNRCLEGGTCSAAGTCDRGGSCKDDRTAVDAKGNASACGDYRCASGFCGKSCVDVNDCNAPAVCTQDGKCAQLDNASSVPAGGSCATLPGAADAASGTTTVGAIAAALLVIRLRRKRE
jgi:Galactose oxidase, central domain